MNSRIYITALALLLLAFISSCSKDEKEDRHTEENDVTLLGGRCGGGCDKALLVHHPALDPTYDECGNVEYWECPRCHTVYADMNASEVLDGFIYRMPTRFITDKEALGTLVGYDSDGVETKVVFDKIAEKVEMAALAAEVAGFMAAIASLGVSIASLSSTNEALRTAINELSGKMDKTPQEVATLSSKIEELSSSVSELSGKVRELKTSVGELGTRINTLVNKAATIDAKADKIFSTVQNMSRDLHLQTLINHRHDEMVKLYEPTIAAFKSMKAKLDADTQLYEYCTDVSDSISVSDLCMMDYYSVVASWGNAPGNYAAITEKLITTYAKMDGGEALSYPKVIHEFMDSHITWSHSTYLTCSRQLIQDRAVLAPSYLLARIFYSSCNGWDQKYRNERLSSLTEGYQTMQQLFKEDSLSMEEAYDKFRYCNVTGKKFSSQVLVVDPKEYVRKCINYDDMLSPVQIDTNLQQVFGDNLMDRLDLECLLQSYCGDLPTVNNLLFEDWAGGMELFGKQDDFGSLPILITPSYNGVPAFSLVCNSGEGNTYGYEISTPVYPGVHSQDEAKQVGFVDVTRNSAADYSFNFGYFTSRSYYSLQGYTEQ